MSDVGIQSNILEWNLTAARYVDDLGMAPQVVLPRQMGLLTRTLINLTPPLNRAKTRQRIQDRVEGKFATLASDNPHAVEEFEEGGKAGHGDVRWYGFYPDAIYGVTKDKDMTGADVDELYRVFLGTKLGKGGRIVAGKRGKQTVYLWQKILAAKDKVKKLADRLKNHIGRLKGGWLVGWRANGAPAGTLGPVPEWILKHETGARGYVVDGLGVPDYPSITVANFAVGASEAKLGPVVRDAMRVRTKAMVVDLELYAKGVKK